MDTDKPSNENAVTIRARALCVGIALVLLIVEPPRAQTAMGVWEGEIQDPERPVVGTIDFDAGVASLSGGPALPIAKRDISEAQVTFELINGTRVLTFSGRRDGDRIFGTLDREGQSFPFSFGRLPSKTPPRNRVEAWQQDLDAVATRFLRYDRSFDAAARAKVQRALERLKQGAGSMSDAELFVGLSRVVAMSGNAHTRLYFIRNRTEVSRLPVRVWWFGNELRIVRTAAEQQNLLGCRVIRIGGRSADEAFRLVRDVKAGNASWRRYMSAYYLTSPEVLAGAGVIADARRVVFTVACEDGRRQVMLPAPPVRRSTAAVEAWWDLAPAYRESDAALSAFALPTERAPRYLRNVREHYWFELVPEDSVLYFQYNRADAMASKPMAAFATQLADAAKRTTPKAFVVDLRFNTGGNLNLATPLVHTIAPLLNGRRLFVLTGRATFSAGITHAAQWKQRGAVLIGEPVGDGLDFWSEGGNLLLPNSQLAVHYTNGFHRYSKRDYPLLKPYYFELQVARLTPDVVVETTWDDYKAGRDPLYAAVRQRLR